MEVIHKYGLDFGTTNSSIALRFDQERKGLLENICFEVDIKNRPTTSLPSIVYIDENAETSVGTRAKNDFIVNDQVNDKALFTKIKLILDNEKKDIVVKQVGDTKYRISDIIAILLKELRNKANRDHVEKIDGLVIGVPVNYDDNCKQVMINAAFKAGFYQSIEEATDKTEFISEPVAVALDYGVDLRKEKTVYVIDFGGGTLDVTIMKLKKQVNNDVTTYPHEVIYKDRLTLGGEKFTELFFKNCFIKKFGRMKFIEMFQYPRSLSVDAIWNELKKDPLGVRFIDELDYVKCCLSSDDDAVLDFHYPDLNRNPHIRKKFTADDFRESIAGCFDEIRELISDTFNESGMYAEDIDEVLLAGGSSLIPCIQDIVFEFFDKSLVRNPRKNALTSIVKGLAVAGYQKNNRKLLSDIVDSDYGIWDSGNNNISIILPKGTKIDDTEYDRFTASGGISKSYIARGNVAPKVEVYQNKNKLGEFFLPQRGGGVYRIFFSVDAKKGWLSINIYDIELGQWYENVMNSENSKETFGFSI